MPSRHQIDCVNKSDRTIPYERIRSVGGPNPNAQRWKLSQEEAIRGTEDWRWQFYVARPAGDVVDVIVSTSASGNKYLKTTADGDAPNNLLALPECA